MPHPLHNVIADLLRQNTPDNVTLIVDDAGGGDQRIPLFTTNTGGRENRLCCVDALGISCGSVRLIVEVDESNVKPTHLAGKYLTSALANFYIHDRHPAPIPKADSVAFLQIVSTKKLKPNSKKLSQWCEIERMIQSNAMIGSMGTYGLFAGSTEDFTPNGTKYESVVDFLMLAFQ